MFGDTDGGSFLTESLRSSGKGDSPKVTKSSGKELFNGEDQDGEGENELFSSSSSK